jgi:hypothetical protein
MTTRPAESEYAPYYARYVDLVPETDVLIALEEQLADIAQLSSRVTGEREQFRYGEGKWSIREVLGHLIDAERVFGYRAFCISRGEQAPLPSFDENAYVAESRYDERSLEDLAAEFAAVRRGNLAFLRKLDNRAWQRMGTASSKPISVRALAFIMAGHVRHHRAVLESRYAVPR